ncbi:MAG TPA: acyl carrier protein [Acetobacteraceae bacterium]|jgi:acyl carrier protein|nr:acyl carrier protein [Acetobacteraceae bacterium]
MIEPALIPLLSDVLGVPPKSLTDGTTMKDVETWDSLRHIELVVRIEETFGLNLGPDDIVRMTNVAAIRAVLAQHGAAAA